MTSDAPKAGPEGIDSLTIVLSSPRTGSTLLCRDIASLGGMGSAREYFRGFDAGSKAAALSEEDVLSRLALGVQQGAPRVGAVKLMVQQARPVAGALTGIRPASAADAMSTVLTWAQDRFERVCVVMLVRNALDQAISRAVADATGIYHSTSKDFRAHGERPIEGIDINPLIMRELLPVVRDRMTLQAVADKHADCTLLLTYDELVREADETTKRLVAHARAQGFAPDTTTPKRRLTKVISAERADDLRRGFLDYLASESGV